MISGRWTMVSTRLLPQNRPRASSHATAMPGGRLAAVAVTATRRLSLTAVHSSSVMPESLLHQDGEALLLEGGARLGALEQVEERLRIRRLGALRHCRRIDDRRVRTVREGADDLDVRLGGRIG